MKFSKSFRKKKIAAIDSMGMTDKGLTYLKNPSNWFRTIVFLVAVICILFFGSALWALARSSLNAIAYQTVKLVSHSFGDPMKQDLNGNINVLFVGVGGDNHA